MPPSPSRPALRLLSLLLLATALPVFARAAGPDAAAFLPNDPRYNPWIWPLARFGGQPGQYAVNIHMGFCNVDYFCQVEAPAGGKLVKDVPRTAADDVTREVLARIDALDHVGPLTVRYGVGNVSPEALRALLPRTGALARIEEGRQHGRWSNPETHAKVFQCDDGAGEYYTVHGSLNLQTVGLTCKGNNALRFVEDAPNLSAAFAALAEAAGTGDGTGLFPGGRGTVDSSGDDLPPVAVGDYVVRFYGGRAKAFVGGFPAQAGKPWPLYLNAPSPGQHAPGVIDWYDAVIFDAAAELRQGRDVVLDVAMFEIGPTASFIDNLYRFVAEGFAGRRGEDRTRNDPVPAVRPGNLTVRLLWQFEGGDPAAPTATATLLTGPSVLRRVDAATGKAFTLESALVWPSLDPAGRPVNPGTPRDMHNKFVLLDVPGHETGRRIYVSSSNLDTPGLGSGRLWQAGTIVAARPGSGLWSGGNAQARQLFTAYKHYFELLWASREGQPGAGQAAFHEAISREHLAGRVNWIETAPDGAPPSQPPRPGIDAFFFPVPLYR